jgi:hypothetical protein
MSWVDNIGTLIGAAANAASTSAGSSAISTLTNALNGNRQYAQAAQSQLTALQVAFASNPPNTMSASFALAALSQMVVNGQLPAAVGPQLQLLETPAIQSNPVAVAQAIAAINSLLNH